MDSKNTVKEKKEDIVSKPTSSINQVQKKGNPNWHKGMVSPNPQGAGLYKVQLGKLFSDAFLKDKELNKQDLFELAFQEARKDNKVLTALLNKFVPDLIKGEGFDTKIIAQLYQGITTADLRTLAGRLRERVSEKRPV